MLMQFVVAFGIVAICVSIHITALITLVEWLLVNQSRFEHRVRIKQHTPLLLLVFAVVTILHVIEAGVWAVFYYWYQLFPDWETCLYFSLGAYTTLGNSDAVLPQSWRLLGTIEGISGVLLCGLSGAFLFAIINAIFTMRLEQIGVSRLASWGGTKESNKI